MKTYKVTWHEDGTVQYKIVKARSRREAMQIVWNMLDTDDAYVYAEEVEDTE